MMQCAPMVMGWVPLRTAWFAITAVGWIVLGGGGRVGLTVETRFGGVGRGEAVGWGVAIEVGSGVLGPPFVSLCRRTDFRGGDGDGARSGSVKGGLAHVWD